MPMRLVVGSLLSCALIGCAVQYKVPDTNLKSDPYKTGTEIPRESITRNSPYRDISRVEFVVLRSYDSDNPGGYREFLKQSLLSMGFKKVLDEPEFARLIIEHRAAAAVPSTTDLVALNRLQSQLGPFLVIEAQLFMRASAYWRSTLAIVDPESAGILLEYDYSKYVILSLNQEFTYPSVNLIRTWYQSSQ